MDKVGKIPSIIKDHVERFAIRKDKSLLNTPDILLISLSLPGIDWDTTGSYSSSSMIL